MSPIPIDLLAPHVHPTDVAIASGRFDLDTLQRVQRFNDTRGTLTFGRASGAPLHGWRIGRVARHPHTREMRSVVEGALRDGRFKLADLNAHLAFTVTR